MMPIKKTGYFTFILSLSVLSLTGQKSEIAATKLSLPTYAFDDPNPLPSFIYNPKIYPYHKFQGYAFEKSSKEFNRVTLENDQIKVFVIPEVGGKVWGAIDKSNGNEFIYKNEVVKFRNIAMRGPWTSGGIEFNFGIIGHHPGTATPVDYKISEWGDGSVSCVVGGIDLPSRTQWRVDIILPPETSAFTTKALWYNPTETEQAYYNWMTAAARARDSLVFYTPGNQYLTHGGEAKDWPIDPLNRNLSHYSQNKFGPSKSYHVIGEYNDFFGGYYTDTDVGFGHWGRYDEIPGQKLWLWNLSRAGGIWEDLLTDDDGQYIEYQSGRLFVQYFPGEENPISQAAFEPHLSDQWTEAWFPIKKIGGLKEASKWGAMNVEETQDSIHVKINSFKTVDAELAINFKNGSFYKNFPTSPNGVYMFGFSKPKKSYEITVAALGLKYESHPKLLERNFKPIEKFKHLNTNEKKFLKAKDAQRYREFGLAETILGEVLEADPFHLEARKELGTLFYRNGQYGKALEVVSEGLQIDTYHNGLNYVAGISYMARKDWTNAIEHLGWAARSIQYRSVASALMAQVLINKKDFGEAMHYNETALKFNSENINALAQKIIIHRNLKEKAKALNAIEHLEKIDPLHHMAAFEKLLLGSGSQAAVKKSHRSEFPYQTFLELALFYVNRGMEKEAIRILNLSPKHLMTGLWKAYLNRNAGSLAQLLDSSIAFVFPFRKESLEMLHWVVKNNSSWKAKYFLALNLIGKNQTDKGIKILKELGQAPKDPLFYYIRGMAFKKYKIDSYTDDLEKAYATEPDNWRYAFSLAEDKFKNGRLAESEKIIRKTYKRDHENYFAGMLLAQTLNALKKYDQSVSLLDGLKILPYEHATEGRKIYTDAYVGSALQAMENGKTEKAEKRLRSALLWPEHIGVGKPFDPDERLQHFLLGYLANAQKNDTLRNEFLQKIAAYSKEHVFEPSVNHLFGIYAIDEIEGNKAALKFIKTLRNAEHGESSTTDDVIAFYFGNQSIFTSGSFLKALASFLKISF